MAKKPVDSRVVERMEEATKEFVCPACGQAITLSSDEHSYSAFFCPTCRIHRDPKDFTPVEY
jgi:predicted RNA-binding Zn-ribbon protein involved in translation (DUF1610 family)